MFSIFFFFWKIIQIVVRFANAERIHVGPSSARRPVVCTQSGRGLSLVRRRRLSSVHAVRVYNRRRTPDNKRHRHRRYPYRRAVQNVYVPDDAILLSPLKRVGVWLARPSVFLSSWRHRSPTSRPAGFCCCTACTSLTPPPPCHNIKIRFSWSFPRNVSNRRHV